MVPKARGAAARRIADAEAYRDRVISEAEGISSRFVAVLAEYEKAPEVTRERLYLDALEQVLANSPKVLLDAKSANNLMYLPLDKIVGGQAPLSPSQQSYSPSRTPIQETTAPPREVNRGRRVR